MNKYKVYFLAAALIVLGFAAYSVYQENGGAVSAISVSYENPDTMAKRDLLALKMAYPEDITGFEKDGQTVTLLMKNGAEIVYDDGQPKSFDEKLGSADVQDAMEIPYPLESIDNLMSGDEDPGRVRCYALLKAVYGGSQSEVEAQLTSVDTGAGSCPFNGSNGAADALAAVFSDVAALMEDDPGLYGFVYPMSGTFNYRVIAGTGQLSPHAFAIAVDLCRDSRDYWQWAGREQGQKRLNEYPPALVGVFESHGFIWGGKWSHFDFLHFEYRPELIIKARYAADPASSWHDGFPDSEDVQGYVKMIEEAWK